LSRITNFKYGHHLFLGSHIESETNL